MGMFDRFEKHVDKTFRDAAERYLREYDGKDKTRAEHSVNCLMPYLEKVRLIDIDDELMQEFKRDRIMGTGHFTRKAMSGTCNKDTVQLGTILNKACRVWRWLPSTPKILGVSGECRMSWPLTFDEQDKIFRCLPTGWDVGAAIFAVNTGVRKAELFGLKWDDQVRVPGLEAYVFVLNDTKNGEQRAVVCNSIARRAVDAQMAYQQKHVMSEYVFPSRAPGHEGNMVRSAGKVFFEAWKKAGMPMDPLIRKGIHNLRHTFAHRLRAAGVSQENRNAALGHKRMNLAEHYALPDLQVLATDLEKITERKDSAILRSKRPGVTNYMDIKR